jgi:vancomycin resistance protein YoaR
MSLDFLGKRKKFLLYGSMLAVILLSVILAFITLNEKGFYRGIYIEKINISGLRIETARALLKDETLKMFNNCEITLKEGGNSWIIYAEDIGLELMIDQALNEAYKVGRTGNPFQRLYSIINARYMGCAYFAGVSYQKTALRNVLTNIKKQIEKNEKNAEVRYKNGNITFVKEEIGKVLDVDENLELIDNYITRKKFGSINLITEKKFPSIMYSHIKEIKGIIGSYSTKFSLNDSNRCYNIRLACQKISGSILLPDEVFSMNEALGPRTLENGYKEAPVILKNELVKGTGGGVCQVTTTLYNSVLRSKLEVCERTHHSMPLGYVQMGLDATIAEDYIDFKFKNNSSYPVCIYAYTEGNSVHVVVLGKTPQKAERVELKSVVTNEYEPKGEEIIIDDSLSHNERIIEREAKKGYRVVVYRETYDSSGNLVKKEKISEDVYSPVKARVRVSRNYDSDVSNTD